MFYWIRAITIWTPDEIIGSRASWSHVSTAASGTTCLITMQSMAPSRTNSDAQILSVTPNPMNLNEIANPWPQSVLVIMHNPNRVADLRQHLRKAWLGRWIHRVWGHDFNFACNVNMHCWGPWLTIVSMNSQGSSPWIANLPMNSGCGAMDDNCP